MTDLTKSKEVVVSRSLAIESDKVRLVTLITALFYDLSPDKLEKVPSNSEKRERLLLELIQKARLPVALFVDDAHGLHSTTLVSLKKSRSIWCGVTEKGQVSSWRDILSSRMI